MKIVSVCRAYPTHRPGGMLFVVQDRARALVQLGHEVHVLTTSLADKVCDVDDEGVMVHHLQCAKMVNSDEFAAACVEFCDACKPDIIHSDSLDVGRNWWVKFKNTKTAVTLHGFAWGDFFTKWNLFKLGRSQPPEFDAYKFRTEMEAINTFNTVIGTTIQEHWLLQDLFSIYRAKQVYNPISRHFFETEPLAPPEKRRFLCATITGQSTRLFELAKEAAVRADVELLTVSAIPRKNMPQVYDSVSAVVVPTAYAQCYDLTIPEALSRCRPAIVSATGSYLREAEFDDRIVTVPLGDVGALAEAMVGALPVIQATDRVLTDPSFPLNHAANWLEAVCTS